MCEIIEARMERPPKVAFKQVVELPDGRLVTPLTGVELKIGEWRRAPILPYKHLLNVGWTIGELIPKRLAGFKRNNLGSPCSKDHVGKFSVFRKVSSARLTLISMNFCGERQLFQVECGGRCYHSYSESYGMKTGNTYLVEMIKLVEKIPF